MKQWVTLGNWICLFLQILPETFKFLILFCNCWENETIKNWVHPVFWFPCDSGTTLDFYHLARVQFSSVQFSHSVVSDSLRSHESQHARPPCPSVTPGVNSNSCPSSRWCHPAISSSVIPFSSCPQPLQLRAYMYIIKCETDRQSRLGAWDKCSGLVH